VPFVLDCRDPNNSSHRARTGDAPPNQSVLLILTRHEMALCVSQTGSVCVLVRESVHATLSALACHEREEEEEDEKEEDEKEEKEEEEKDEEEDEEEN
jgi:hypothetical protein